MPGGRYHGRWLQKHDLRVASKLVWVESPGSTTMEVQDLPAIVAAARDEGVLVGCDNTWATPLLFKPLAHGADFSMHALSVYAGGHADLLMGSVTVDDLDLRKRLRDTIRMLGFDTSPADIGLALHGPRSRSLCRSSAPDCEKTPMLGDNQPEGIAIALNDRAVRTARGGGGRYRGHSGSGMVGIVVT